MFKFYPNGINLWKKALVLSNTGYSSGNLVGISKINAKIPEFIFLTGHLAKDNAHTGQGQQFIIKTDSLGHPVKWKIIKHFLFYDMIVTDDGIYLWDKNPSFLPLTVNQFELDKTGTRLIKLDHDLNLQWAKRFSAENFSYFNASLTKTTIGDLIMSHATFGSFPAILTQLDQNGNIVSQKGYPNFTPTITALSNGGLMLASPFENVYLSQAPVIAKTDANGDIPGCTTYPTCIEVEDFTVEFQNFQIDTVTAFDLFDLPAATVQPLTSTFQPYCNYPPAPIPNFTFPDTLCLGEAATTLSEGNRLAQAREWHLTGPAGLDSLLRDSFEFSYQFKLPGEYLLRQTVWVLGCATSHERAITVLPPLTVSVVADSLICPDEQPTVLAVANRIAAFTWNTGQSGAQPFINGSGTYAVTASDGHCEATDSASITVVAELLNGASAFTLPPDTTTCLPYDLVPQSEFAELFYTDTDPTPRPSIRLEEPGSYRIGMAAFGCEFWQTYHYGMDCHVDVYLPTSFSPNGDGINDVFMPYGNLFEVLDLRVYDRWGGLLHQGKDWDGGKAVQGVYLYELRYLNLRSGLKEEVNGQVLLVR
ncbi:MAG: gliding motility-associated C-terminal domain-containing protein [Saprospiraceae bacterium]|nr:gliding motility-associated C-terminal domain-containing protein [Saprospiraceae bacterium]